MKTLLKAALITLLPTAAIAGTDFGSDQEARAMTEKLVDIVNANGIDAGIAAMHDPSMPFSSSKMGIHIFEESIIVADNREPELISVSYKGVADKNGNDMWEMIEAAAAETTDFATLWEHYDTQEPYEYHCFNQATSNGAIIMTCR